MNILLDTNIAIQFIRARKKGKLNSDLNPSESTIFISIATEAELKSISIRNRWGQNRVLELDNFLANLKIIEISQILVNTYVAIDTYSQCQNPNFDEYPFETPRNMGKNDLWIASTASLLGLQLFLPTMISITYMTFSWK